MRHSPNLPWDDGSRRSPLCPPSHFLMALPSYSAQASARTAHPSGPSTTAVPQTLSAPAILLYCLTATFSDAITENSRPQNSWAKISQKLAQVNAMLARISMEPLYHSPPPPQHGGSTIPTACDLPSARVSPPNRLAKGSMAPLPATTAVATPSPSLAHPSMPAWFYPSHPN
jgi:hypothetical protein